MSTLVSRNVSLNGRRTSLRLEREMWDALDEICAREGWTLHAVCAHVENRRRERTLTAGIRVYVLQYYRQAATEDGHAAIGHGRLR